MFFKLKIHLKPPNKLMEMSNPIICTSVREEPVTVFVSWQVDPHNLETVLYTHEIVSKYEQGLHTMPCHVTHHLSDVTL